MGSDSVYVRDSAPVLRGLKPAFGGKRPDGCGLGVRDSAPVLRGLKPGQAHELDGETPRARLRPVWGIETSSPSLLASCRISASRLRPGAEGIETSYPSLLASCRISASAHSAPVLRGLKRGYTTWAAKTAAIIWEGAAILWWRFCSAGRESERAECPDFSAWQVGDGPALRWGEPRPRHGPKGAKPDSPGRRPGGAGCAGRGPKGPTGRDSRRR